MQVKGHTGTVEFDGQFVSIHRTGFNARMSVGKGTKRIPLSSVTAVQFKPAGAVMNGFIQFTVPGGNERRSAFGRQTNDALHDENSVLFTKKQAAGFEQLRAEIEHAIAARQDPQAAMRPQAGLGDQLAQLSQLRASGALTEPEFQAAKARLLG